MRKKDRKNITRKDFIKKSSTGLLGAGICLNHPFSFFGQSGDSVKRILGRTGLAVTPVCFGASRSQLPALSKAAIREGINFIDTGRSYANGQNEVMVGKVIKDIRKNLIIQSKVKVQIWEKGDALKSLAVQKKIKSIMQKSLEESLKALQTDYIDIWLLHGPVKEEIVMNETIMEFFAHAKEEGRIRACGFSTHSNQVELLQAANESKFYDVVMVAYNHKGSFVHSESGYFSAFDRKGIERELKKAYKNNMGVIAMKTCSGGPYATGNHEPAFSGAVKWVIDQPFVHAAAVAMANFEEIQEHAGLIIKN